MYDYMKGKELLMIPVCMIVFGCGSAFCANFEEFLAFVPLVLAVCLSMWRQYTLLAPPVGLEPTTTRLTAACSTN